MTQALAVAVVRPALGQRKEAGALRVPPMRSCVACRRKASKFALIRLAVEGSFVVADVKQRMPGRGAYVCPAHGCLQQACKRKGLMARLLRGETRGGTASVDAAELSNAVAGRARETLQKYNEGSRRRQRAAAGQDAVWATGGSAVSDSAREGAGALAQHAFSWLEDRLESWAKAATLADGHAQRR